VVKRFLSVSQDDVAALLLKHHLVELLKKPTAAQEVEADLEFCGERNRGAEFPRAESKDRGVPFDFAQGKCAPNVNLHSWAHLGPKIVTGIIGIHWW